jgi:hypothetical protein
LPLVEFALDLSKGMKGEVLHTKASFLERLRDFTWAWLKKHHKSCTAGTTLETSEFLGRFIEKYVIKKKYSFAHKVISFTRFECSFHLHSFQV